MVPQHRTDSGSIPARLRRSAVRAVVFAAAVLFSACYHNVPVDPPSPGQAVQLESATVTTNAGQRLVLFGVTVDADSVIGREHRTQAGEPAGARIALARSEVKSVERSRINIISLALPLLGLAVMAFAFKEGGQ